MLDDKNIPNNEFIIINYNIIHSISLDATMTKPLHPTSNNNESWSRWFHKLAVDINDSNDITHSNNIDDSNDSSLLNSVSLGGDEMDDRNVTIRDA